ncbi:MAG: hypothetical protein HY900_34535 [Deltaproteobacteria bacterium]|nr:hypothetical protein [Deltaproteobacteria bacterium]
MAEFLAAHRRVLSVNYPGLGKAPNRLMPET